MKTLLAVVFSVYMLAAIATTFYAAYCLSQAALAMTKLAEDNRDIFPNLYAAEKQANYELGQIAKDRIRIRELLKKLEGRTNGTPSPAGTGTAKRNP